MGYQGINTFLWPTFLSAPPFFVPHIVLSHKTEVKVSILKGFDQYVELYQWSKNRVTKNKVEIVSV